MKFLRLTPFLICLVIIEVILICVAINYLLINNRGGMALAGTIAFVAAIVNIIILLIEQVIVTSFKIKTNVLWFIETLIIILFLVYISINGFSFG